MSDFMAEYEYGRLFTGMDDKKFSSAYQGMMMVVTDKMCTKMLRFLYTSILEAARLRLLFENGTLSFENSSNRNIERCFRMTITGNGRSIVLSIAIPSDRYGNRAKFGEVFLNENTELDCNPSTLEILIISAPADLEESLGYDGDAKSFFRCHSKNDPRGENGFYELIDEIISIHEILNLEVSELENPDVPFEPEQTS